MNVDEVRAQAECYSVAAATSLCPQVAALMRRQASEWEKAAKSLDSAPDDEGVPTLVLAGTLTPGCRLYRHDWDGPVFVLRISWQQGVPSIMTRDDFTGREQWWNVTSSISPVVMV